MKNKKLGMLLGLHVGDSLGATLEFRSPSKECNFHREIIGGGRLFWNAGDPTDDTDLMLLLLENLAKYRTFNPESFSHSLIGWLDGHPRDVGKTIEEAIRKLKSGVSYLESGLKGEFSKGNGSLMRCAPLALLPADESEELIQVHTAITHAHPLCIDCDLIYISALRLAILGVDKNLIFEQTLQKAREKNQKIYSVLLKVPTTNWNQLLTSGYVLDSLCASFWGLLHTESFEDALVQIVNRGDDADTCGAITGALCGAYYGVGAIPERWLEKIKKRVEIERLVLNF